MAVYYINPSAQFNGDGTLPTDASGAGQPGAANIWPGSVTADTTYSLKSGTTLITTGLFINQSGITVNSYGTGKATIDGYTSTANKVITAAANNQTYDNLIIKGSFAGNGTTAYCFQNSGSVTDFTVINCELIGQADTASGVIGGGVSWTGGWPITIDNNEIYNVNIGIISTSSVSPAGVAPSSISNNYIHTMIGADSDAGDNDCISMLLPGGATMDFEWNFRIANNRLRDFKENGVDVSGGRRLIVEYNDIGPNHATHDYAGGAGGLSTCAGILMGTTGGAGGGNNIIRGNYVHDLVTPGVAGAQSFSNRDSFEGTLCYGNIAVGSDGAYGSYPTVAGKVWKYYNNVAINPTKECFRFDNQDHQIYNCISVGGTYSLFSNTGSATITYGNNCFYNASIAATGGNNTFSNAGGNITSNPLLDSDYYPYLDSPCIQAGIWTGKMLTDRGGRPFKRSRPSIGAWEVASRDPVNRTSRE